MASQLGKGDDNMSEKSNFNRLSMYLEPWRIVPALTAGYFIYSDQLGYVLGSCDESGDFGCVETEYAANIIAAAPEMLSALMALTTAFYDAKDQELHHMEALEAGFAAIGKAVSIFKETT
jgi:hypothetical protein